MDRDRVLRVVKETFELQDMPDVEASQDTVEGWDSLGHLRLCLALEREFNVKFKMKDMPTLTSVEKIICLLEKMSE